MNKIEGVHDHYTGSKINTNGVLQGEAKGQETTS